MALFRNPEELRCPRVLEVRRHGNRSSTVLGGWSARFGFPLGLLEIFSLAPLQKISAPLCWYILGRVIFTLCSKQRNMKHQWTDGHIAHRWQHTTLLAYFRMPNIIKNLLHYSVRKASQSLGTFETLKLEIWAFRMCLTRWSLTPVEWEGKESHLFFMTFTPGGPAECRRNCKCWQFEWMQSRFMEEFRSTPLSIFIKCRLMLRWDFRSINMTNFNALWTWKGGNSLI